MSMLQLSQLTHNLLNFNKKTIFSWRPRRSQLVIGWLAIMVFLCTLMISSKLSKPKAQKHVYQHPEQAEVFEENLHTSRFGSAKSKVSTVRSERISSDAPFGALSNNKIEKSTKGTQRSSKTNRSVSEWLSDPDVLTWKMDWRKQVTTGLCA